MASEQSENDLPLCEHCGGQLDLALVAAEPWHSTHAACDAVMFETEAERQAREEPW